MLRVMAKVKCLKLTLQKLMTQSVNSLLALRMMGRGNSLPPGGLRGGRGGMERGRGRGNVVVTGKVFFWHLMLSCWIQTRRGTASFYP